MASEPRRKRQARSKRPRPQPDAAPASPVRLQKFLAACGIGSRRACEEWITAGRVEVNGVTVTTLGTRVTPGVDVVRVDGDIIRPHERCYFLVNKPVGVVCSHRDPSGRMRVVDLVPSAERLFPIGRLDRTSEGLILLTNDGDFAHRLAHPRYGVPKTYRARVAGHPERSTLQRLRKGVYLAEGKARVESIRVRRRWANSTELEIVLREGKNREIRRILARVGHKVLTLKRVAIGPVRLDPDLPPGAYRPLTARERRALLKSAATSRATTATRRSARHVR